MTEGAAPSAINTDYAPTVQESAPVTVAAAATPTANTPRPGSIPPPPVTSRPDKPVAHGGPTRQFLNQNITPHLLEGIKYLAVYEPEKPLLWLSEFLKDRSKEIEG
jgi:COMPASS component SDC1